VGMESQITIDEGELIGELMGESIGELIGVN
jgi:hypothetical protein